MHSLAISLLGQFQVTRDGLAVSGFRADTARALLAYLAMHAGVACRREALAGLLWPDQPEETAQQNLRQVLYRLRQAIGDRQADLPFLRVTRKAITFDPESDYWLDVQAFEDGFERSRSHRHRNVETCHTCFRRLGEAVELYRSSERNRSRA